MNWLLENSKDINKRVEFFLNPENRDTVYICIDVYFYFALQVLKVIRDLEFQPFSPALRIAECSLTSHALGMFCIYLVL